MPSTVTRARRARRPVVAVVGAADGIGPTVTAALAASGRFTTVRSVEPYPLAADLGVALDGVDVVVHLGLHADGADRRPPHVRATRLLLDAAAATQVPRLVVVTSAMVYGARADNPLPLSDAAPLQAPAEDSLLGDLVEVERLCAAHTARPDIVILRPTTLVGPGADSALTRHFEAPRLLVVSGAAPCWQFCHVTDLAAAVLVAACDGLPGPAAVGSPGWLSQEEVEALSGLRSWRVPEALAVRTVERLRRAGVTPAQPSELAYHIHPWVVGCDRLREAGWVAAYDNATALTDQLTRNAHRLTLGGTRVNREAAGRAAAGAGATIALVGTAAMVRAVRRRRRVR